MKRYPLCCGLLVLLASGATLPADGAHISPEQALARVQKSTKAKALAGKASNSPTLQSTIGNLYIFSSEAGYMILPADDRAPALLGYSDKSSFSIENNPALAYWLDFYNQELSSMETAPSEYTYPLKAAARADRMPIAPLTSTRWNQETPYNDKCPELNGKRSVTGCVATAMAQVMKYHSYPEKGRGSHSYNWTTGGKELSCDFSTITFDWKNMTDTYSSTSTAAQKDAVATLMLACGISVDMDYTPVESSAVSLNMGSALISYFDYDQALWMPMRDYYGLYEWEDMIYADLEKGLPVLYAGRGTGGGHQFICDGYSSDGYFHFNWGWGGLSDGYFLLTALNPSNLGVGGGAGGFNTGQQIALGVQPPVSGSKPHYLMYCTGDFLSGSSEVNVNSFLMLTGGFFNYSMTTLPENCAMGIRLTAQDGTYDEYLNSANAALGGVEMLQGYRAYHVRWPSLSDGVYTIRPAFYNGERWEEMPVALGKTQSIIATVSNGNAQLSSPAAYNITVTDIDLSSSIYQNRQFPMSFSIVNSDDTEYIGKVIPILVNSQGSMVAQSVYRPVDILGNSSESVSDYIGNFAAVEGAAYTPGNYYLLFCDESGRTISKPVEVTVKAAPTSTTISVTNFKMLSENPVMDKENVKFGFNLACTAGYYSGQLLVVVFPYRQGSVSSVAAGHSEMLYLDGGKAQDVAVNMDLSTLEPGKYFAMVYNGQSAASNQQLVFEISQSTGIKATEMEKEDKEPVIYNLQGTRCTAPLSPGLYIIDGKKVMVK